MLLSLALRGVKTYTLRSIIVKRPPIAISIRFKSSLSRRPIGGSNKKPSSLNEGSVEFDTWKAAGLMVLVGTGLYFYFKSEKKRIEEKKKAESTKGYGKPLIGGPFDLIDQNGNKFTQENLKGKMSLIYFGFTHCPDICPDELDRLGIWLDSLKKGYKGYQIQPIFITCDPARDSPKIMKEYLEDFHDGIIGLTGDYQSVKQACKAYRVYFSTPENIKPGQDYLVDHSVFFYLMNPEGEFLEVLGMNYDEVTGVEKIKQCVDEYIQEKKNSRK